MTAIYVLVAALFAALVFLSQRHYTDGIELLLGALAALAGLLMLALIIGHKGKQVVRKIYILYAPQDTPFVAKLYEAMRITPYRMLWDKKEVRVGDHIEARKRQLLAESTDVIFVISKHSAPSDWSKPEIGKIARLNKRIFPVLIDDSELPEELREIMFADFRSSFDDGYFSLRDALKANRYDKPARSSEQKKTGEPGRPSDAGEGAAP